MTPESRIDEAQEYQFGSWRLSTKDQLLIRVDKDNAAPKTLEPLIYELLVYFVQHSGQIVTRQTLVEDVWRMSFVDDNAINRAMSELRKVLKLPDNNQSYIKTHYKKGYSFVPEVTAQAPVQTQNEFDKPTEQVTEQTSINVMAQKPIWLGVVFLFVATAIWGLLTSGDDIVSNEARGHEALGKEAIGAAISNNTDNNTEHNTSEIYAVASRVEVSWQEGLFFLPSFSPSQQFLAYSFRATGERFMALKVKNLYTQSEFPLIKEVGDVYPVSWYSDTVLVYRILNTDKEYERCDYYSIDVTKPDSTPRYLWNCNHSYTANAALIDNQNTLLVKEYNYRNKSQAAAIFAVDLASRMKFQVTSPNITGTGDFYFSVSNNHKKFVFLRSTGNKVELFLSDVEGSEQRKLLDMTVVPGSITWANDDEALIWLDHRNWQLVKYDLETAQVTSKSFAPQGRINASYAVSVADFNRLVVANDYIDNDVYALSLSKPIESLQQVSHEANKFIPLANSSVREAQGHKFALTERHLYATIDGALRIWLVQGDIRTPIYEHKSLGLRSIDLRADDKKLLLTQRQNIKELDLVTEEFTTYSLPFSVFEAQYFSDSQWLVVFEENNKRLLGLYDHVKSELIRLSNQPITSFTLVGDNIIFTDNEEYFNMLNITSKKVERLFKLSKLIPKRWTADDQNLYYLDRSNRIMKKALHHVQEQEAEELFIVPGMSVVGMKIDYQLNQPYLILSTAKLRSNFLYDIKLSSENK